MVLLSFNPPYMIESVSKNDYYTMMNRKKSINIENRRRMTMKKAQNIPNVYKLSYFKRKSKKGSFRFEGGLRYFQMHDFSFKFYTKLKNLTIFYRFRNFSNDKGLASKLTWCGRVIQSNPSLDKQSGVIFGKTASKSSKFLDKFSFDPREQKNCQSTNDNTIMSKLLPFSLAPQYRRVQTVGGEWISEGSMECENSTKPKAIINLNQDDNIIDNGFVIGGFLPKEFSQLTHNFVKFREDFETELKLITTEEDLDNVKIYDPKQYTAYKKRNKQRGKLLKKFDKEVASMVQDIHHSLGQFNFLFARVPTDNSFQKKSDLAQNFLKNETSRLGVGIGALRLLEFSCQVLNSAHSASQMSSKERGEFLKILERMVKGWNRNLFLVEELLQYLKKIP